MIIHHPGPFLLPMSHGALSPGEIGIVERLEMVTNSNAGVQRLVRQNPSRMPAELQIRKKPLLSATEHLPSLAWAEGPDKFEKTKNRLPGG
jgi:hypothetical protein